jgi:hypothetical protein
MFGHPRERHLIEAAMMRLMARSTIKKASPPERSRRSDMVRSLFIYYLR